MNANHRLARLFVGVLLLAVTSNAAAQDGGGRDTLGFSPTIGMQAGTIPSAGQVAQEVKRRFNAGAAAYARGDYDRALSLWRPLAAGGSAQAQYNIGTMYAAGRGVPRDLAEAARWLRMAAELRYPDAEYMLGRMYGAGQGVAQDPAEALRLIRDAADQGFADAQQALGLMYYGGSGVEADAVQAYMWLMLAAAHHEDDSKRTMAQRYTETVAATMTPAQIAEAERLGGDWTPVEVVAPCESDRVPASVSARAFTTYGTGCE